ncbi:MAG: arginase family protein [Desulfatitalea sp.]|nr:arginase family protein [Desulfatitalea sp.]
MKKVIFFGCPLDCDEKHDAIQEKLNWNSIGPSVDDPLKPIAGMLADAVAPDKWQIRGSIPVPGWLRPIPPIEERARVNVEHYVNFIDRNGCREFAGAVESMVKNEILPDFPCLIAVDHALSGGAYKALAEHYGRSNLSLLVLDSHTDAVPMSRLAGAILYDAATNKGSIYDTNDPYLHQRSESYNASTFVHHLLDDGILDPRDLYIIGISDYPPKKAFRIDDPRIAEYVEVYSELRRRGATLITRQDCQMQPTKVKSLLKKIQTPYAYLSIDMDIGARNAVEGVRFKNWQGLGEKQIYRLAAMIGSIGGPDLELVGLDITEINPRTAGQRVGAGTDQTYQIAASLITQMVFDLAV